MLASAVNSGPRHFGAYIGTIHNIAVLRKANGSSITSGNIIGVFPLGIVCNYFPIVVTDFDKIAVISICFDPLEAFSIIILQCNRSARDGLFLGT